MKTKIHYAQFLVVSLAVLFGLLGRSDENVNGRPQPWTKIYTNAMDAINAQNDEIIAQSRLLYELAAERYASNTNNNRKWVLTYHHGRKIRRYTDGNYTIIALPIVEPRDESALRNYCTQYNSFSARTADVNVQAGDYREAKVLYRLLHHLEHGDLKGEYEKKLKLLDKLERNEDVEANLKKFMELSIALGLTVAFSEIEKIQPTVVSNLLEIRLP